jgi:hypothetical protein
MNGDATACVARPPARGHRSPTPPRRSRNIIHPIHPPLVTGNEWHGLGLQHTSPLPAQQGFFLLLNERSPTEALLFYTSKNALALQREKKKAIKD